MKAIQELGIKTSLAFLFYSFFQLLFPLFFISPLRVFILRIGGSEIGGDAILMGVKLFNLHHTGLRNLKIGKRCFIGDETLIDLYDQVTLEDEVTLAQRVTVLSHINVGYADHPLQKFFLHKSKPVKFKRGSVICASSTIIAGVTVGECSLVAAGSVVTHDVPAYTMVGGVPAKVIKKLK